MTLADKLREEGRQEGRKEAYLLGIAEGQLMGMLQLLQGHMGRPVSSNAALEALTIEQLKPLILGLAQEFMNLTASRDRPTPGILSLINSVIMRLDAA